MKTVFLHGMGQKAEDWNEVIRLAGIQQAECPDLYKLAAGESTFQSMLKGLEELYKDEDEPFILCGLSLGAILALDYTLHHQDKVSSLILIGAQYKVPTRLIDFQNLIFRLMPESSFRSMGASKKDVITLSHSMRSLDYTKDLRKLNYHCTIICGSKDKANLKASEELSSLLPDSELRIIPDAGHEINKCAPAALAQIIESICKN